MKTLWLFSFSAALSAFASGFPAGHHEALGPRYDAASPAAVTARQGLRNLDVLRRWNEIAINASGLDHTPVQIGENRVFGEQIGPCRSSRAIAIVHIAMFDTMNSVARKYKNYTDLRAPDGPISMQAAISQAAHDTLTNLFPSQRATFDARLAEDLDETKRLRGAQRRGVRLGQRAAAKILALRASDGSAHPEPRVGTGHPMSEMPGRWRQDPISQVPLALGAKWGACKMFVLEFAAQFRVPPPPALDSPEYATAFNEVKRLGGDGVVTPTERTAEQTEIGIYWGYDGTPSLCAPPRLYNQIATQIAEQMESSGIETARLLALVNVAMAEAGTTSWESKYYWDFWRPVTGIREADAGTGPTGSGDGNPATMGDTTFSPLGAPASNLQGPNFTPPFPAYPSGHATFGGALFQTLRRFYGRDDIAFTFVSDEYNGVTRGNDGNVRPLKPRTFATFSQAEEENGQSRIYLGIHWSFDKTEGIAQGRRVADYVFDNAFQPRPRGRQ